MSIDQQRTMTVLAVLADRIRELTDEVDMYRRQESTWDEQTENLKDRLATVVWERDKLQYHIDNELTERLKGKDNYISILERQRDLLRDRIDNELTQPPTWDDVQQMMQEAGITYMSKTHTYTVIMNMRTGQGDTLRDAVADVLARIEADEHGTQIDQEG
jgi:chromosome segregation ATPase